VVWGGMHGAALALDKLRLDAQRRAPDQFGSPLEQFLGWAGTLLWVMLAWVFFRSPDFSHAWIYLRKLAFVDRWGSDWVHVQAEVVLALAVVAHLAVLLRGERELGLDLRRPLAWTAATAALLMVLFFSPFSANPFIYFQF